MTGVIANGTCGEATTEGSWTAPRGRIDAAE